MLINFWYAAELSGNLRDKPVKARMLGQNFVLFRDSSGSARCLSNVCIHRCASLSDGWVSADRVVCPYHGWEFAGSGQCQRIPSLGPGPGAGAGARAGGLVPGAGTLRHRLRVPGRPAGSRAPARSWRCPSGTSPAGAAIPRSSHLRANYRRVVENALDPAHAEYVHVVGPPGCRSQLRRAGL